MYCMRSEESAWREEVGGVIVSDAPDRIRVVPGLIELEGVVAADAVECAIGAGMRYPVQCRENKASERGHVWFKPETPVRVGRHVLVWVWVGNGIHPVCFPAVVQEPPGELREVMA